MTSRSKPLLLDLFCKAGGAGAGYAQAGFEVVGVDIEPQRRYPFDFIQGDVLALTPDFLAGFDAIHASPPCQAHTSLKTMHNAKDHPNLIPATRAMLKASGKPYVIENVEGAKAELIDPILLCGTMFGLGVEDAELRRHRLFETSFPVVMRPQCQHTEGAVIGIYGGHVRNRRRRAGSQDRGREDYTIDQGRAAMGCDWMTVAELSQAIPPAYTRFLGEHLLRVLNMQAAA